MAIFVTGDISKAQLRFRCLDLSHSNLPNFQPINLSKCMASNQVESMLIGKEESCHFIELIDTRKYTYIYRVNYTMIVY